MLNLLQTALVLFHTHAADWQYLWMIHCALLIVCSQSGVSGDDLKSNL